MSIVFFGDSITEGSNCDFSFAECIEDTRHYEDVVNLGVSGTTIGEYSIYPVDGDSLLRMARTPELGYATKVFIEYGINDVSSIMCGFVDEHQVIVNFVKALDGIQQRVNNAELYFLAISCDTDIIKQYAKLQCDYLSNEYFRGFNFTFPSLTWADQYERLIDNFSKRLKIIPMVEDDTFFDEDSKYLSFDKLHPNDEGHHVIADTICKHIEGFTHIFPLYNNF